MRRTAAVLFSTCTAVLLLGMSFRMVWLASQMETGLQILTLHWRDATVGWVLGNHKPIPAREPSEQAEFWLKETERILQAHREDSQLAMGAAWVLDSPGPDYAKNYLKRIRTLPPFGFYPELDREGIKRAEAAFESRCGIRCLQLATTAAECDPANLDWWRLRALLLWRESRYAYDENPRDPNWREILDQCTQHDPENALYDYLAARFYWNSSAEGDFSDGIERLVIEDPEGFQHGIDCFRNGQAKPYFAVGDAGFPAVAQLLQRSRCPLTAQERVVNSRSILLRRSVLLRVIWRWQDLRAVEEASAGDVKGAMDLQRQNLHMISQYTSVDTARAYDQVATASEVYTAYQMETLTQGHPELFTVSEIQETAERHRSALLRRKVIEQASRELAKGRRSSPAGVPPANDTVTIVAALAVDATPGLVILLLVVGLVAVVLSRCSAGDDVLVVGPVGQTLAACSSLAFTIVVFGFAPAEIVNRDVQAWGATVILLSTPVVLAAWIGWCWLRRREFRFSLRTMLTSTFVLCLLFGLVHANAESFEAFPFDLSVPARGWEGLDAASVSNAMAPNKRWLWSLLQWVAYDGPYLTLATWAALILFLHSGKVKRAQRVRIAHASGLQASCGIRKRLGGLSRSLGRGALALSACTLLTYLSLAPRIMDGIEQNFQQQIAFARQPQNHWTKVQNVVRKVESDEKLMAQLKKEVEAEISEEANGGESGE